MPRLTVQRLMAAALLILLTAVSIPALLEAGYVGLITQQLQTWAGRQIGLDLVIACSLCMLWLWRDARRKGRNPWPYLGITLFAGSYGPLLYLLLAPQPRALLTPQQA